MIKADILAVEEEIARKRKIEAGCIMQLEQCRMRIARLEELKLMYQQQQQQSKKEK